MAYSFNEISNILVSLKLVKFTERNFYSASGARGFENSVIIAFS